MSAINAVNAFGLGTAILGVAGMSIAVQASRQVLEIPRVGRELSAWPVLLMLAFMCLVDLAMIAAGVGIAMLEI